MVDLLAESQDAVNSFSPYAALGANAILVSLCVWLITKHLPEQTREFRETIKEIQAANNLELAAQRTQSSDLAKSGHETVERLSSRLEHSFHELAIAITELGAEGISKSAIHRRREARESIHE